MCYTYIHTCIHVYIQIRKVNKEASFPWYKKRSPPSQNPNPSTDPVKHGITKEGAYSDTEKHDNGRIKAEYANVQKHVLCSDSENAIPEAGHDCHEGSATAAQRQTIHVLTNEMDAKICTHTEASSSAENLEAGSSSRRKSEALLCSDSENAIPEAGHDCHESEACLSGRNTEADSLNAEKMQEAWTRAYMMLSDMSKNVLDAMCAPLGLHQDEVCMHLLYVYRYIQFVPSTSLRELKDTFPQKTLAFAMGLNHIIHIP